LTTKVNFYSKSNTKSSVISLVSQPILYKSGGIGPSVGHNIAKMEASPLDDASTIVKDGVLSSMLQREKHVETLRHLEPSNV